MSSEKKEIKIRFPETLHAGVYANNTMVSHTKEEFLLDFLMAAPPTGSVVSRIVMSPAHVKRLIAALQTNVGKYENTYGSIQQADLPPMKMGFSG